MCRACGCNDYSGLTGTGPDENGSSKTLRTPMPNPKPFKVPEPPKTVTPIIKEGQRG